MFYTPSIYLSIFWFCDVVWWTDVPIKYGDMRRRDIGLHFKQFAVGDTCGDEILAHISSSLLLVTHAAKRYWLAFQAVCYWWHMRWWYIGLNFKHFAVGDTCGDEILACISSSLLLVTHAVTRYWLAFQAVCCWWHMRRRDIGLHFKQFVLKAICCWLHFYYHRRYIGLHFKQFAVGNTWDDDISAFTSSSLLLVTLLLSPTRYWLAFQAVYCWWHFFMLGRDIYRLVFQVPGILWKRYPQLHVPSGTDR